MFKDSDESVMLELYVEVCRKFSYVSKYLHNLKSIKKQNFSYLDDIFS